MITVSILVKPGSSRESIEKGRSGELVVRIPAKAIDGAANVYLVEYLARVFGLRKNEVVIEKGQVSKHKRIRLYTTREAFDTKVSEII